MVPNNPHFSARFMEREKHKVSYHSVDTALEFCSSSRLDQKISEPNSEPFSVVSLISLNAPFWFFVLFFFTCLLPTYFSLGFAFFLWPWQEILSAVFQYTQAGLVLGRRVSLPICNHCFMAFTGGVNADQMENSPA